MSFSTARFIPNPNRCYVENTVLILNCFDDLAAGGCQSNDSEGLQNVRIDTGGVFEENNIMNN